MLLMRRPGHDKALGPERQGDRRRGGITPRIPVILVLQKKVFTPFIVEERIKRLMNKSKHDGSKRQVITLLFSN